MVHPVPDLTTFEDASVHACTDLVVDPPGPVNAVTVTFRARLHDGIVHTLDPWKRPSAELRLLQLLATHLSFPERED